MHSQFSQFQFLKSQFFTIFLPHHQTLTIDRCYASRSTIANHRVPSSTIVRLDPHHLNNTYSPLQFTNHPALPSTTVHLDPHRPNNTHSLAICEPSSIIVLYLPLDPHRLNITHFHLCEFANCQAPSSTTINL